MHGAAQVLEMLNAQLTAELAAMEAYFLQSKMFARLGYTKLSARFSHESEDERRHADQLLERILILGGTAELNPRNAYSLPGTPLAILQDNLAGERQVRQSLLGAIKVCFEAGDHGSRAILERLLTETEEDHIKWLESQLGQIEEIGLQGWLAEQIQS